MANVQHSTITDPNIHEPKGASSATTGTLYVSNGAGSGVWKRPEITSLSGVGALAGSSVEADGAGNLLIKQRFVRTIVPSGTLASATANTTSSYTIAVAGVLATDEIIKITKPSTQVGLFIASARVLGAGSISIQYANITGSGIVPASEDLILTIWRN